MNELPINQVICGDALSMMKFWPAESIDMCITSPPYWGLRDYGTGPNQLGLEPTPELYIEHLTKIFNEVKRVLKKEGTFWLNMGDTYNSTGTHTGKKSIGKWPAAFHSNAYASRTTKNLPTKCILMIPERLAWSLIQSGWILRNKIVWHKPNAMPSSVKDRFSTRWEYVFLFSKSKKYYFDLDAVREPHTTKPTHKVVGQKNSPVQQSAGGISPQHELGKNPGDIFEINTQPFPGAHFAVFPEKLCEKPIKAGCPKEVCKKCRRAKRRIIEPTKYKADKPYQGKWGKTEKQSSSRRVQSNLKAIRKLTGKHEPDYSRKTIGWTSCKCNVGFEGGIVLDPFAGAGTALCVAKRMKRRYIGIDIKQKYCNMARRRLRKVVYD